MANARPRRIGVVLFGVLTMAGALVGCNLLTSDDNGEHTPVPSEGEIYFSVEEGYTNTGETSDPKIFLTLKTGQIYGCCNYSILTKIRLSNGRLRIDLMGIAKPNICLTATGPATYRRQINLSAGEYDVEISNQPRVDYYRLFVTEASIRLQPVKSEFTKPVHTIVWRYPRNSFAFVCGTTAETSWIYRDFLEALLASPGIAAYEFPDYGYVPYPEASDGHWVDHPARYFLYETESDYEEAGKLLNTYSEQTISQYIGVTAYLVNYRNRKFMSWMFMGHD